MLINISPVYIFLLHAARAESGILKSFSNAFSNSK